MRLQFPDVVSYNFLEAYIAGVSVHISSLQNIYIVR